MSPNQTTPAVFTPGEAERITGVSVTLQRDWRRRGFLPANEGHARFEAFELAEMLVLQVLAERGIGPTRSRSMSWSIAARVIGHASRLEAAWEGGVAGRETSVRPSSERLPHFFIWASGDHRSYCDDVDAWFRQLGQDHPARQGAIVVLDLAALARALVKKAGRALYYVEAGA